MSDPNKSIVCDIISAIFIIIWTGIVFVVGHLTGTESTLGKIKRGELTPKTVVTTSTNVVWEDKK